MCVCEVYNWMFASEVYIFEVYSEVYMMAVYIEVYYWSYNEWLIYNEVLTQSYIREKLLPNTWHFFLTFAWAERRFMLWWQQTHKFWPGLEHICQWDDKFGACSENVKRILKSPYFKIKRRKCKTKKDVKLLHVLFYCRERNPF